MIESIEEEVVEEEVDNATAICIVCIVAQTGQEGLMMLSAIEHTLLESEVSNVVFTEIAEIVHKVV